jgi:microsomal dipeptidase-like Zn-dependent dipeptidase
LATQYIVFAGLAAFVVAAMWISRRRFARLVYEVERLAVRLECLEEAVKFAARGVSFPPIVDLHAHYPMHLADPANQVTYKTLTRLRGRRLDWLHALILWCADRWMNYPTPAGPGVTIPNLRSGNVGVALSVVCPPFDEFDFDKPAHLPPASAYFLDVIDQINEVETDIRTNFAGQALIAHNPKELALALGQSKVALIHAVEGAVHLGATAAEVKHNVHVLRACYGVAYITVAHLFWRHVARNAPALPLLSDRCYNRLFPEPDAGLCALGQAAVEQMLQEHILIDVTHMSERAIDEVLGLAKNPSVPLIATHEACRFGKFEYTLSDSHIQAIGRTRGVIGLIACERFMAAGMVRPKRFADSMQVIYRHINKIRELTGSFDHIALGSDLDGFIKPTLPGLDTPADFQLVQDQLIGAYGPVVANKICSGNALRVLQNYWQGRPEPVPDLCAPFVERVRVRASRHGVGGRPD